MIKYEETLTKYVTIKQGEENWLMEDNYMLVPRAYIEISEDCPDTYKYYIQEGCRNGWIKLVAYVRDRDYMWEKLEK